jgi:EKC/KEOPS complex subunit PCC1/LAGE3
MNDNSDLLTAEVAVPFSCEEHAKIAYNTLVVDQEPRKNLIRREFTLNGSVLTVNWSAKESRILRVSTNSFIDSLNSILETIQLFDTY